MHPIMDLAHAGVDQEPIQALRGVAEQAAQVQQNFDVANQALDVAGPALLAQAEALEDAEGVAFHVAHLALGIQAVANNPGNGQQGADMVPIDEDLRWIREDVDNLGEHEGEVAIEIDFDIASLDSLDAMFDQGSGW